MGEADMDQNKKESSRKILGIDIGGTGIKIAPVDISRGKIMQEPLKEETPRPATPESVLSIIKKMVKSLGWEGPVGCGFPGIVKNGIIYSAANLDEGWMNFSLKNALEKQVSSPASVINDADAAALAEMQYGVGRKWNQSGGGVVLFFTLGTGIGSAVFINGQLVPNTEFGHMEMNGKDAEKWAATVIRERENISWKDWGTRVNEFLNRMEKLFSPDVIIIGGGISEDPQKFFPYLHINAQLLTAQMANEAGIIGAAMSMELRTD
jgi:polyphosphate glucokinase